MMVDGQRRRGRRTMVVEGQRRRRRTMIVEGRRRRRWRDGGKLPAGDLCSATSAAEHRYLPAGAYIRAAAFPRDQSAAEGRASNMSLHTIKRRWEEEGRRQIKEEVEHTLLLQFQQAQLLSHFWNSPAYTTIYSPNTSITSTSDAPVDLSLKSEQSSSCSSLPCFSPFSPAFSPPCFSPLSPASSTCSDSGR